MAANLIVAVLSTVIYFLIFTTNSTFYLPFIIIIALYNVVAHVKLDSLLVSGQVEKVVFLGVFTTTLFIYFLTFNRKKIYSSDRVAKETFAVPAIIYFLSAGLSILGTVRKDSVLYQTAYNNWKYIFTIFNIIYLVLLTKSASHI